jgi:Arc/MetJ-type ribon-helix-helix transcriptional regulator
MMNKSVRVPQELLEKIDLYVYEKKYYATRADFILAGVRQLVYTYAQKKREVAEQVNVQVTKEVIEEIFRSVTRVYLEAFDFHKGESTQISFRIPEGLDNQVSSLLRREYGFNKKADFPRAGIMCLIAHLGEVDDILSDTNKFMEDQLKIREDIYKIVMEGMKNNLSGQEIITGALQKLTAEHDKTKK